MVLAVFFHIFQGIFWSTAHNLAYTPMSFVLVDLTVELDHLRKELRCGRSNVFGVFGSLVMIFGWFS